MARKFTRISQDAFSKFAIDAGLVLNKFDVDGNANVAEEDIICATTGDVSATCVPTYSDMGEDVNNCPAGMIELMNLDGWETRVAFTALDITEETLRLALGAADVSSGKVTPRRTLNIEKDFGNIWLVFDLLGGGYAAVHLMNALSTAGLSLTLTKNAKGQLQVELMGHVSIENQDVVPMEFYVSAAQ